MAFAAALCVACSTGAQAASPATNDDFTLASDPNNWQAAGGACLTAGDGTGSIPACVGLGYYTSQIQVGGNSGYLGQTTAPTSGATQKPDPVGYGALRFTNGYTAGKSSGFNYGFNQAGSIIYDGTPFPTGAGLQVVFKTVTYRGDSGGSGNDGADGMSFFLMDGAYPAYDTGAFGGSLGYSCSNTNNDPTLRGDGSVRGYDGLAGAYLGLGIDEYGNFLNQGDNTASGYGYKPGRIGLRGAGNINWQYLNANYPSYYPSTFTATQQTNAVKNTCASGYIWNTAKNKATSTPVADYLAIPNAYTILSSILPGKNIANESAMTRGAATPITYNLKITQNGLLSLYVSYGGGTYLPVITKQDITASNGAVPSSFRFGFAGSTGGSTNIHEILCFQATPADVAGTSVGINQKEATKIESGTQAFLAYYYPSTWTGRLTASDLLYNAATKSISISSTANWDASCNLTGIAAGAGNACPSTGVVGPVAAQAPATRAMLAWDGTSSKGVAFEWNSSTSGSAISSAEQATLDAGDPTPINANRLNYLRGDRTNEINTLGAGLYRARDGVLGDIIDSSPTWVGPPVSPYAAVWQDRIVAADPLPENSGTQSYAQFLTAEQTRLNVVYDGANDGFLHGFRAGAYDANGNYVNTATTPNDGREVLAYMPYTVLQNIHNTADPTLDYSNAQYSHNYFTDATPGTGELFFGGAWHTWLVGGLGAGGADIYALDVTNPANFSEGNAGSLVVGDWTAATISCANVSTCGNNLGNTYGVPVIRRLHDGKWGVIFGNGFGSKSGDAGIYVMIVDPTSGAVANTYYLSTGVAGSNGIASVATADLDGDHITDYVYAGDLRGNVWRFDLTSGSESAWAASATPLFTIPGAQPITTKLLLATTPSASGAPRVMVDFGAGRKFPQTNLNPVSYQPGTQSLYGIWDWNMGAWNALGGRQFASLSAPQTVGVSNLATQSFTKNADGSLDVTDNAVCWSGSTTCTGGASANNKYGFVATLPNANEQVVFDPALYGNGFIVNTTIPAINSPTSCQLDHDTGDTIAISVSTGGSLHGFFRNTTDTNTAGSQTNATGTPFFVLAGGQSFMLTQTLGGGAVNSAITCQPGDKTCSSNVNSSAVGGKRLTWIERR